MFNLEKQSNTNKTFEIFENISLKDKNWFGTGGAARYYCQPDNEIEFGQAIHFAQKNNLEIFVLGQGANILISDDGFDGLVIKPNINHINIQDNYLTVGSGVSFAHLIDFALNNSLIGLEEFSGIPGTVGGSVYINIHYFEFLLSQFIVNATVIEKKTGNILSVDNSWFNFGYNNSKLLTKEFFLIDATFKLTKVNDINAAFAKGRSTEIIRHRLKRYPYKGTCGSFFRNFYESEINFETSDKKIIFVAYYLDKIGIKGKLQIGDAIVSYQHANMIVNKGSATTNDIINLAQQMQYLVNSNFGLIPQPECQLIGFKKYPLMK